MLREKAKRNLIKIMRLSIYSSCGQMIGYFKLKLLIIPLHVFGVKGAT
ncbi:hypothetical protein PMEGAPR185_15420 [Priestia megaterium]